jgi:cell division transport system permease protein
MASQEEIKNRRGVQTSYVSALIGISLVLFMIGLVVSGFLGLDNVQTRAKESLQGDLFFKPELNVSDIKQIEQELKTWKYFKEVVYISPERAIQEFSGSDQNAGEILTIFDGENPLPPTIGFKPKAAYASKQGMKEIKNALIKAYVMEIDEVNYDESSVDSVNLGFRQFVFLFLSVAVLLIVIAIALINNTIRLSLYSQRFSIKTMQLVGATPTYIRKPFLSKAVFQGLFAALLGMALLMTLFFALNNVLDSIEITYTWFNFAILLGTMVLLGVGLTWCSTRIALNRYLKRKLDELY